MYFFCFVNCLFFKQLWKTLKKALKKDVYKFVNIQKVLYICFNNNNKIFNNKNNNKMNELIIDLGFIGHQAEKLQNLFEGYTTEPNENGYFLKFENYSELVVNQGVQVWTNCFESEEHFNERLMTKLLLNL